MKINIIPTYIAIGISSLITFGLYSMHPSDNQLPITFGSFVFLTVTLVFAIGVNTEYSRKTTNIRVISSVFFIVALVSSILFTLLSVSMPIFIMITGVIFLIYLLLVYALNNAKQ